MNCDSWSLSMMFLGSFGFCKKRSWYILLATKPNFVLFRKCFFILCFILKFFHKYDSTNLFYGITNVEETFRAWNCQMCGNYFKKKRESHEHLERTKYCQRYQDFKNLSQKPKLPWNIMGFNIHNSCHTFLHSRK